MDVCGERLWGDITCCLPAEHTGLHRTKQSIADEVEQELRAGPTHVVPEPFDRMWLNKPTRGEDQDQR